MKKVGKVDHKLKNCPGLTTSGISCGGEKLNFARRMLSNCDRIQVTLNDFKKKCRKISYGAKKQTVKPLSDWVGVEKKGLNQFQQIALELKTPRGFSPNFKAQFPTS